jgi:hypothetical protein
MSGKPNSFAFGDLLAMSLDPNMAALSDFGDALVVARRAKRIIVLCLLLMLLAQLSLFFTYRYTSLLSTPVDTASTGGGTAELLQYASGCVMAFGLMLSLALPVVLLLICHIMLVGRLIGVGPVVGAFVLSLFLALILFPWQALLHVADLPRIDSVIPGVFYSWRELIATGQFSTDNTTAAVMKWTRFVGAPAVALLILLMIQIRSGRGLRMALGEDAIPNNGI